MIRTTVSKASTQTAIWTERAEFVTGGSLRGVARQTGTGYLTGDAAEAYRKSDTITYTVLSYATPIAWFDHDRGWVVPDTKYSATTSTQQSSVRRGITMAGLDYVEA